MCRLLACTTGVIFIALYIYLSWSEGYAKIGIGFTMVDYWSSIRHVGIRQEPNYEQLGIALPALIVALKDQGFAVAANANQALSQIGKPAIPPLITALTDKDPVVRSRVALALGGMGTTAKLAVPPLTKALKGQDTKVRVSAVWALLQMKIDTQLVLPVFITALKDQNEIVKMRGREALRELRKLNNS